MQCGRKSDGAVVHTHDIQHDSGRERIELYMHWACGTAPGLLLTSLSSSWTATYSPWKQGETVPKPEGRLHWSRNHWLYSLFPCVLLPTLLPHILQSKERGQDSRLLMWALLFLPLYFILWEMEKTLISDAISLSVIEVQASFQGLSWSPSFTWWENK